MRLSCTEGRAVQSSRPMRRVLNRTLSAKIANGEVDLQTPGLKEHLWQTTMDKLAVDQPNYASYKRELKS